MSELHVSCAVQGGYVPHSAAMLHSLLAARGEHDMRVHYLHGPTLPARAKRRLERMVTGQGGAIEFLEVSDDAVGDLPDHGRFTSAMWYRIFLPELVPGADRVLYVDVDTLAVDALAPLWDVELGDHLLGAVTNVFEPFRLGRIDELGLPGPEVYFNSGVLFMNLDAMRAAGSTEALRAFAVERGAELLWPDQDTLNLVLGERRLALHPRWNAMNSVLQFDNAAEVLGERETAEARGAPAIRHFEGPAQNKPWHVASDTPHRELYFAHRRATPWPRGRLDGVPRRAVRTQVRQCLMPMRPV